MSIERAYWFGDYQYRSRCPSCLWSGPWRMHSRKARFDLRRHKNGGHYHEELIEPGDFEQQAKKWRRAARIAEGLLETATKFNRLFRIRNLRLEKILKRCKPVLDSIGMAHIMEDRPKWLSHSSSL